MLIDCPDCRRSVSDRAVACPQCGFPIAEHVAGQRRAEASAADRQGRRRVGDVDCVACDARGFQMLTVTTEAGETRDAFAWCEICSHTGRVAHCESPRGHWAIAHEHVEAFVAGRVDEAPPHVVLLGPDPPGPPRYPAPDSSG